MRSITLIIVHCSANRAGSALRLADIDRHHRSLGWKGCGYHYVIPTDGTPADTRTEAQRATLRRLLASLHRRLIVGHRDLDPLKACPCFDAAKEYADLQPR